MNYIEELLGKMIPRSLMIWLTVIVLFYALYYFIPLGGQTFYSHLDQWYESQKWESDACLECEKDISDWDVSAQVPKYVADFIRSEVLFTLRNITTTTQTAAVGLDLDTAGDDIIAYIRVAGEKRDSKNTVNLKIPSQGNASAIFAIRVSGATRGQTIVPSFRLNGMNCELDYSLRPEWQPREVFRLWVTDLFLLPPASNIIIPVFSLIFVSLMETIACMDKKEAKKNIVASIAVLIIASVVEFSLPDWPTRLVVGIPFVLFILVGGILYRYDRLREELMQCPSQYDEST